jgi:hypothetical protein
VRWGPTEGCRVYHALALANEAALCRELAPWWFYRFAPTRLGRGFVRTILPANDNADLWP